MAFKCGQKPGTGRYVCTGCGEDLYLDDDSDKLPPCAKCEKCEFKQVKTFLTYLLFYKVVNSYKPLIHVN
ncbi:MAG TPA: hypothetical protein PL055_06040 [Methanobacterium sp.]|jgi:DNA-directed RNA polymerase subunit RPC12/RpoP|nr:MAG: hypothetical protein FGO69_02300 [Methanobacterium sp.]HOI72321.1 hypothetical protein [Methanobacterium sp.]HPX78307.1 hypothetical protein [Methanobacterium sp.]